LWQLKPHFVFDDDCGYGTNMPDYHRFQLDVSSKEIPHVITNLDT